LEKKPKFSS
jgi:hypothetical protein